MSSCRPRMSSSALPGGCRNPRIPRAQQASAAHQQGWFTLALPYHVRDGGFNDVAVVVPAERLRVVDGHALKEHAVLDVIRAGEYVAPHAVHQLRQSRDHSYLVGPDDAHLRNVRRRVLPRPHAAGSCRRNSRGRRSGRGSWHDVARALGRASLFRGADGVGVQHRVDSRRCASPAADPPVSSAAAAGAGGGGPQRRARGGRGVGERGKAREGRKGVYSSAWRCVVVRRRTARRGAETRSCGGCHGRCVMREHG